LYISFWFTVFLLFVSFFVVLVDSNSEERVENYLAVIAARGRSLFAAG
jgi:hypothetical protein